jgi:fumarate hydratase, class II
MKTRTETDSFGPIQVPADRYWGAQTERSRLNFRIGEERMPRPLIGALAIVKLAAAQTNLELGSLDTRRAKAIMAAAQEIIDGKRSVSARRLADRLRHPDQHERQ